MPVSYRTPGAYFEWQDSVVPSIDIPRTDIAGFAGVAERGPLHRAVKLTSWTQFENVFGWYIAQGYLAYAVRGFFDNGGRTCWVVRVAEGERALAASAELVDSAGTIEVRATSPGTWANNARIRPTVRKGIIDALTILLADGTETIVPRVEFRNASGRGLLNSSENQLGVASEELEPDFQKLFVATVVDTAGAPPGGEDVSMSGGADGLEFLKPDHFFDEVNGFGVAAMSDIGEISTVAVPDLMPRMPIARAVKPVKQDCRIVEKISTPPVNLSDPVFPPQFSTGEILTLQAAILGQCYQKRYRFAILDTPPPVRTPDSAITYLNQFPRSDATASYAALYFPWIRVPDPLELTGITRTVPPSGHLAGLYARVDRTKGVHKPPANEVLEGTSDCEFQIDDTVHGELNSANVNAIRESAGRGIRVMGGRTLEASLRLRYINIRRLLIMIEQAIERQLQWTVHEPNNATLWGHIERVVRAFLQRLFEIGMLDGATAEEAFHVRCDAKTNKDVTDQGKAICEIGLQPPYPAEFVIVRLGITRDGVQVEERGGQDA